MNMKVHWVYPALHTKNINIACIQGIPWSFFHGEFREFHEFKAYREFPGFFMAYTGNSLGILLMGNSGNFMNLRLSGSPLCPLQTKEKQILKN